MTEKQNKQGISRRVFLKGAAVAAAAAGGIVPGARITGASIGKTLQAANMAFQGTELLGRPTDHSIMLNMVPDAAIEGYVEYGNAPGIYTGKTAVATGDADTPFEVLIDNLAPDSRYYYRMLYREKGGTSAFQTRQEHTFHTQRARNDTFVFTVISDSHLNHFNFNNPALYRIACQNVCDDHPDLHFDLGDTFILTPLQTGDFAGVRKAYMTQRPYMGLFTYSTPLFLALGNHERENSWNLHEAGADLSKSRPIMGVNTRKRYYLNPKPDGFYTGNMDASQKEIDGDHLKEDYYAFEWGCALFVVLDPYWYTTVKPYVGTTGGDTTDDDMPPGDLWRWTLGKEQYDWLKRTLEQSKAKYKFIMAHQVAGGGGPNSDYGRGGEKATHDYEWGANPKDFAAHRSGWPSSKSVHQLFIDNGVDIFFHGHDHVYAMEKAGSVIYQECPFPANSAYGFGFGAYANDPPRTIVKEDSGHIRVTVSPEKATVDYVRAFLPNDGTNGQVEHSYSITKS
jgi:phosphodiesterase/alkaline phosphatase D-like protein